MATTSTTETPRAPIERTEPPHIVKSADTRGGEPRIEETRFGVRHVLNSAESGMSPAEIAETWPFLSLAQVHDALGYAYDHPDEMARYEEENKLRSILKKNDMVHVAGRLILRERLRPEDIPPGQPFTRGRRCPSGRTNSGGRRSFDPLVSRSPHESTLGRGAWS